MTTNVAWLKDQDCHPNAKHVCGANLRLDSKAANHLVRQQLQLQPDSKPLEVSHLGGPPVDKAMAVGLQDADHTLTAKIVWYWYVSSILGSLVLWFPDLRHSWPPRLTTSPCPDLALYCPGSKVCSLIRHGLPGEFIGVSISCQFQSSRPCYAQPKLDCDWLSDWPIPLFIGWNCLLDLLTSPPVEDTI